MLFRSELMQYGLLLEDKSSGQIIDGSEHCQDFSSILYEITIKDTPFL